MIVESSSSPRIEDLSEALARISMAEGVGLMLVLACDANAYSPAAINPILQSCPIPILGGIFPQVMAGGRLLEEGYVILGFPTQSQVFTIPRLSDPDVDFESALESLPVSLPGSKTMFVFVDGLSSQINRFVEEVFAVFGLEQNYIGGGAGSLSFESKPCLITPQGLVREAAVLAFADLEIGVGVAHGWRDLAGPFEVTESKGNAIASLDWRPACEVYREAIESIAGDSFEGVDFFNVAKNYPFGISKLGTEKVVRDPIGVNEDGAIICVGEVPEHSLVYILTGEPDTLIEASGQALSLGCQAASSAGESRGCLLLDCISRYLFLGERFGEEFFQLAERSGMSQVVGALTLGEIANNRKDYLEFYNKTAVAGIFES
ncbi:FIST signal transduction protein [Pelagicoccus albus]|uniref:FIST C-terminal domain-containing protein n=1 Tax=Pelagicoccus albus TaxID=415222 RepID=A0A7X1E6R0_9BACT|nr:FIST C-terminal domain-containing protein [Pelagicoccus albus]MBC2604534.1 FIST C-terminal domain-containing protein [Pelagicoccus albus]